MTAEQLKVQSQEIRRLIAKDEVDRAIKILENIAPNFDTEVRDEIIKLSANWSRLEREERSMTIREEEAIVQRNQLMDQALDLTRSLELSTDKKVIAKEKAGNLKKVLFGIIGALAVVFLAFQLTKFSNSDIPNDGTKPKAQCEDLYKRFKNFYNQNDYNRAENVLKTLVATCGENEKTNELLQKIQKAKAANKGESKPVTIEKNTPKEPQKQESKPTTVERNTPKEPQTQENKSATSETTTKQPTGNYGQLMDEGETAFKQQNYELAYEKFKAAAAVNKTGDVERKVIETTERLYRKYFSEGMNYFNYKNYEAALKEFKTAQSYKDILQVKSLIKKCEDRLN